MDSMGSHPDIAIPNKQIDCPSNELFGVVKPQRHWRDHARLSGSAVTDELSLTKAFYQRNTAPFAGFKTMPNRHRRFQQMVIDSEVQVICLIRRNLAATIASFIAATDTKSWQRHSERQQYRFRFSPALKPRVNDHLIYLLKSLRQIAKFESAITLKFQDLCSDISCHPRLNDYFERPIQLHNPRRPHDGASYVENWTEFKQHVRRVVREFQRQSLSF